MARDTNYERFVMAWFQAGVPITLLIDLASPVHSHDLYVEELLAA